MNVKNKMIQIQLFHLNQSEYYLASVLQKYSKDE